MKGKGLRESRRDGAFLMSKVALVVVFLKSTALQAAEKLVRAVGPGFIPDITAMESMWALAPEVRFSGNSVNDKPFSAACLAVPMSSNPPGKIKSSPNQEGTAWSQ
jgi:hypothetical protein